MPSPEATRYRDACQDLLDSVLLRPRMYFQTLHDLEVFFNGHASAFRQLGLLGEQSFHQAFTAWLCRKSGVSGAAGLAHAIQGLAMGEGGDAEALFTELVRDFMSQWKPSAVDVIEAQWEFMRQHDNQVLRLLAQRAYREPVLRRLFPYGSLSNLRFSVAASFPYDPMPWIQALHSGSYFRVRAGNNEPLADGPLEPLISVLVQAVREWGDGGLPSRLAKPL